MSGRMVIIGMGAAGGSAALTARKLDRNIEIIVIDRMSRSTYSKCGLPFVIGGVIGSFDTLSVISRETFERQRITLMNRTEVLDIDTTKKVIGVEKDGEVTFLDYDHLIIATGGYSSSISVSGGDLDNVLSLRTVEDGERIIEVAAKSDNAVVNGASFIALEVVEALREIGLNVSIVIRSRALRSMVDASISKLLHAHLEDMGVNVLIGAPVEKINGTRSVESVTVNGVDVPADVVVMATGTRPDVSIAKVAGLTIGESGGILVDEKLSTSAECVYAAGDCVECLEVLTGKPTLSGLGTIAARQGIVSVTNALGGDMRAPPVFNAAVMKLAGLEVGSVGVTGDWAQECGMDVAAQMISYPHLPHYYPGGKGVRVRLLALVESGRIVGAQFMSEVPVNSRINAMSIAMQKGMTVDELAMADLCYSPPCSDTWDPVSVCAQALGKKLERLRRKGRRKR